MMSEVVSLHSADGQKLRRESSEKGLYYQSILNSIFQKQSNLTFCGIVSSLQAMNANFIGKHGTVQSGGPQLPYTEGNMFSFNETQSVLNESSVNKDGCTLQQVADLLKAHGCDVVMYHAKDSSLQEFHTKARHALSHRDSSTSVIINYDLKVIYPNSVVSGHFSPLCAYHEETDRFLILDTWPKTEECWVKAEHLFNALNTVDDSVSMTRGYIIVSK